MTSSPQTFLDMTDQRKLSAYITSNLPKNQIEDPNVLPREYSPDWEVENLVLTPEVFLDQDSVSLTDAGISIAWKRKDGSAAATNLTTGEAIQNGVLIVSANTLATSNTGMITYICNITYTDSETGEVSDLATDITYTLVKGAENAKLAYVVSDTYVFKYDASGDLMGTSSATLTGQTQGVSIVSWQYKNASGEWADYPTTAENASITGTSLIVSPAHNVFFDNLAQIKLKTTDASVYDTTTITKIYDGSDGNDGDSTGGLSIILSNEAQTIACTSSGLVQSAIDIEIAFTGYIGISQTSCTCSVGNLPSGMTLQSNTAATTSNSGLIVLSVQKDATLGGANVVNGVVNLTFSISGETIIKQFSWSKSSQGSNGSNGENAVAFSIYAPNGTVVQNQSGTLLLETSAYDGADQITSGATYQWQKYTSGAWENIAGAIESTYTVSGDSIVSIQSYRCTMTYKNKTYTDVITVEDKSDPYVSEMLSIGGFSIKNTVSGVVPYVIVRNGQVEVDPLLGAISETAPTSPTSGTYWYKIDHVNKTVSLYMYNGSSWTTSTTNQELTYTWYKQNQDGNVTAYSNSGKVIYFPLTEIDGVATLQCNVSK